MVDNKKYSSQRRKSTETSAFGSPGRIGHDSTKFYASKLYEGQKINVPAQYIENEVTPESIDRIFCKSSESMAEIPDYSIHLMVTSPPYNVTKEYDENLTLSEYRELLKRVFSEVYKKLVTGGRACVNIANLGRKPYIPLHSYVIQDMLDIGFMMRGELIWNKASSASPSTAWGTWLSAANPILRDIHEYILVFSKEAFNRKNLPKKVSTITREEFLEFTKSVWTFSAESARKVGHPAPFPVELPYRLIQLYTFKDEVVLDPFCGSGQAAIAAIKAGRHYIGYDTEEEYVRLSERRIREYKQQSTSPSFVEKESAFAVVRDEPVAYTTENILK
ncbi:MAG: site-specific DNA-methyltransferase [Chloroflexi bacterium]|nr:site-specific DNA-methyltransferase [Chloroflexota bacterium]